MKGTGEYGERMNSMPKYVASTTLTQIEWNASLIKGDLAEAVSRLKHEGGQDLLVFGSCELVYTLTQLDLIDEYRCHSESCVKPTGCATRERVC